MKIRGIGAAVSLFFLAPLVAEYLLGDLALSNLGALIALAPMYGGGAILIRETVRRTERGWPTFILLALAYAVMEEGLVSLTLFDPHYHGFSLIVYGYIPALGTALPWMIFVLSLHVIWSMAVPIGLTEALFAEPEQKPWLGKIGLAVSAVLLLFGSVAASHFQLTNDPFRPTPMEIVSVAIAIVLLVVAAFRFPRPALTPSPNPVPTAIVGVASLILGACVMTIYARASGVHWPWPLAVLAELIVDALAILLFWWATRVRTWTALAAWAAAVGAMLVYAWHGFEQERAMHVEYDRVPHTMLVAFFILLGVGAGLNVAKRSQPTV